MVAIVIDSAYRSTRGRKPSVPAFHYDLERVTASDTVMADRFGQADTLTLSAAAGTAWSASPGWYRPDGSTQRLATTGGAAKDYASQSVLDFLTPGVGIIVAYRQGWAGAKPSAVESVLCLGRSHSSSACVQFGGNTSGLLQVGLRGLGASAQTSKTFGSAGDYSATADQSVLFHCAVTATGINVLTWLDGVPIGVEQQFLWSTNGGTGGTDGAGKPASSVFGYTAGDGLTIGAQRGGSNQASPTFAQYMGATNTAGSRLANVIGIRLAAANAGTAQDIALELTQYPRYNGEIVGSL